MTLYDPDHWPLLSSASDKRVEGQGDAVLPDSRTSFSRSTTLPMPKKPLWAGSVPTKLSAIPRKYAIASTNLRSGILEPLISKDTSNFLAAVDADGLRLIYCATGITNADAGVRGITLYK